jgi:hypothetical protein
MVRNTFNLNASDTSSFRFLAERFLNGSSTPSEIQALGDFIKPGNIWSRAGLDLYSPNPRITISRLHLQKAVWDLKK